MASDKDNENIKMVRSVLGVADLLGLVISRYK